MLGTQMIVPFLDTYRLKFSKEGISSATSRLMSSMFVSDCMIGIDPPGL